MIHASKHPLTKAEQDARRTETQPCGGCGKPCSVWREYHCQDGYIQFTRRSASCSRSCAQKIRQIAVRNARTQPTLREQSIARREYRDAQRVTRREQRDAQRVSRREQRNAQLKQTQYCAACGKLYNVWYVDTDHPTRHLRSRGKKYCSLSCSSSRGALTRGEHTVQPHHSSRLTDAERAARLKQTRSCAACGELYHVWYVASRNKLQCRKSLYCSKSCAGGTARNVSRTFIALTKAEQDIRRAETQSCAGCGKPCPAWNEYRREGQPPLFTRRPASCSRSCSAKNRSPKPSLKIGQIFGSWIVKAIEGNLILCRCQCQRGTEKYVRRDSLIAGGTTSCGCRQGGPRLTPEVIEQRLKETVACTNCGGPVQLWHRYDGKLRPRKGPSPKYNAIFCSNMCSADYKANVIKNIKGVKPYKMIPAFGETKSINDWLKDPRCAIEHTDTSLRGRIDRGWKPENAITVPLQKTQRVKRQLAEAPVISNKLREILADLKISMATAHNPQ